MVKVLNLDSQATMIAVKPRPPAVLVEMVWLAPNQHEARQAAHRAGDGHRTHDDLLTLMPTYFAVFSLSPTTEIS